MKNVIVCFVIVVSIALTSCAMFSGTNVTVLGERVPPDVRYDG